MSVEDRRRPVGQDRTQRTGVRSPPPDQVRGSSRRWAESLPTSRCQPTWPDSLHRTGTCAEVWFVVAGGPCPGHGGVDPGGEAHVVAEATVVGRSNVMVMPSCSTTVRARASPVRWVVTDGPSGSWDARTPTPIRTGRPPAPRASPERRDGVTSVRCRVERPGRDQASVVSVRASDGTTARAPNVSDRPRRPGRSIEPLALERSLASQLLSWHDRSGHRIVYVGGAYHTAAAERTTAAGGGDPVPSAGACYGTRLGPLRVSAADLRLGHDPQPVPSPAPRTLEAELDALGRRTVLVPPRQAARQSNLDRPARSRPDRRSRRRARQRCQPFDDRRSGPMVRPRHPPADRHPDHLPHLTPDAG